jgi:hypothetical protein
MADVTPQPEPQSAADYDDRTTAAVKSVLIEIGQVLGSFTGKFAVIGGAVPWLLLDNEEMPHVGSVDVDLSLDAEALSDGEYATLVEALMDHGYEQRTGFRRFQLVRTVPATDGGEPINIVVDFLMPREVDIVKNSPPLVADFAVQRADGADLALRFYQMVAIDGSMPDGGPNRVEIAVCSIPALLAMKGHALQAAPSKKTPTTSTTASAIIVAAPRRWPTRAVRCSNMKAPRAATVTSLKSSIASRAMDPIASDASWAPTLRTAAHQNSGNGTPSVRSMPGCVRWG